MVALLLSLVAAHAQAPTSPLSLPPGFETLSISQTPRAEARWLTAKTTSKRFPGEAVDGPAFEQGERVEVIVADGSLVRVRQGDRYGWVPESVLTIEAPAAPPPAPGAGSPLLTAPPLLVPKTP